jgi:hypothetical protein
MIRAMKSIEKAIRKAGLQIKDLGTHQHAWRDG